MSATKIPMTTAEQIPTKAEFPHWSHPLNLYYESEWQILRDTMLGEKQVKSRTTDYVPQSSGFDNLEYIAYLKRASFYNMVARTVSGMLGTLFRRNPVQSNVPINSIDLNNIGRETESIWALMRNGAQEVIQMGRVGGLVDLPAESEGEGKPYIVLYPVESIINWEFGIVDGRKIPTTIILREMKEYLRFGQSNIVRPEYRVLSLEDGVYRQRLYKSTADKDGMITDVPEVITPTRRGQPLNFIPFVFMNSSHNSANIERPPLIDIARINISHFQSTAQLEHGRFYTGLPIYYCRADSNDNTEYTVGPSVVWKLPQDGTAGIIEFNGSGLITLERALSDKEAQAAALGGRLIGISTASTAESDNMTSMKERNENAQLLNISFTLDSGFTSLLRWICWWQDVPQSIVDKIEIEVSKDFMLKPVGAREFRAMHMMYTDGLIPVQAMYEYLLRAEVIPDWLEFPEFEKLLKSANAFPGQPDAIARMEDYPSMQSKINEKLKIMEIDADIDMVESQEDTKLTVSQRAQQTARRQTEITRAAGERTAGNPTPTGLPQPRN